MTYKNNIASVTESIGDTLTEDTNLHTGWNIGFKSVDVGNLKGILEGVKNAVNGTGSNAKYVLDFDLDLIRFNDGDVNILNVKPSYHDMPILYENIDATQKAAVDAYVIELKRHI